MVDDSLPLLKLVEVLGVLAAGIGFAWWQFSDLAKARRESRREDEQPTNDAAQPGRRADHGADDGRPDVIGSGDPDASARDDTQGMGGRR